MGVLKPPDYHKMDDFCLVKLYLNSDDDEAFETLWKRCEADHLRQAYRQHSKGEAADIVEDFYDQKYPKLLAGYNGSQSWGAYTFAALRNFIIDRLRRDGAAKRADSHPHQTYEETLQPDWSQSCPSRAAELDEFGRALAEGFDILSERERHVLFGVYYFQLKYREIAAWLEVAGTGHVKNIAKRAITKLHNRLAKGFGDRS